MLEKNEVQTNNDNAATTGSSQLTDEQLLAMMQERGLEYTPENTMSNDQKLAAVIEAMGGFTPQDGLSPEETAQAEADFRKDLQLGVYEAEKIVATKYPDASDSQKFEVAKAFLSGDLLGVLQGDETIQKTIMEKDSKQKEAEKNLHVEGESTANDTNQTGNISSLSDVLGAGGMLSQVKHFGS